MKAPMASQRTTAPACHQRGIALPACNLRGIALPACHQRGIALPACNQRGIALPAMVFMVVMVGLLLSAGLQLLTQSQHSQTLQLQAARALAGAKSGAEWGLWRVSDNQGALGLPADTLPPCFATQALALPAPLQDLTVQVSCVRVPATGSVDEGGLKLASYRLIAEASSGSPTSNAYVRRQIEARHTVCKNPGGTSPAFNC